jgi:hypothetical protein
MKTIGTYYYGIEYEKYSWFRINLFPLGFSISFREVYGLIFELSIFNIKLFFGSKVHDDF